MPLFYPEPYKIKPRTIIEQPAYSAGTVCFQAKGFKVLGFDSRTGSIVWEYSNAHDAFGGMIADGNRVYVQVTRFRSPAGGIVALDSETGQENWRRVDGDVIINRLISVRAGCIVLIEGEIDQRKISAWNTEDGIRLWGYMLPSQDFVEVVCFGEFVCHSSGANVVARNLRNGDCLWSTELPEPIKGLQITPQGILAGGAATVSLLDESSGEIIKREYVKTGYMLPVSRKGDYILQRNDAGFVVRSITNPTHHLYIAS